MMNNEIFAELDKLTENNNTDFTMPDIGTEINSTQIMR